MSRPLAAALTALALAGPAGAADVGVMAAVNRDVTGERPQETPRALVLNDRLILDERVITSDRGGGQVMFLDQTTLTLSPNSDIILDRYLYDPDSRTGEVSISMLKGAMRLVGGRITKSSAAMIKTPTATIGIRGGIGHVTVEEDGSTTYIHIAGQSSTVSNDGGSTTVTREGGTIFVPATPGGALDDVGGDGGGGPKPEIADRIARVLAQRRQGGAGGAGDLLGRAGGPPRYAGVATPERVRTVIRRSGGFGGGGARVPVTSASTAPGMDRIEPRVSGAPGAAGAPPISTTGETEEGTFNEFPEELGRPPEDEIADANLGRAVADEITQLLDGLEFQGRWSAIAGLKDGTLAAPVDNLRFDMQYSLGGRQGVVVVELPETGDLPATNLTTLSGVAIRGDRFLVVGDDDRNLTGDSGLASLLGGDATDTEIRILVNDEARGAIVIDYGGAPLANLDFVDGDIAPVVGVRVSGDRIDRAAERLRRNR